MLICNVGPLEEHVASVRALVATGDQQNKVVEELNALQESLSYTKLQQVISVEFHAADALADLLNVMETHEAALKKVIVGSPEDSGVVRQTLEAPMALLEPVSDKVNLYWKTFVQAFSTATLPFGDDNGLPNLENVIGSLAACQLNAILPGLFYSYTVLSDAAGRFRLEVPEGVATGAKAFRAFVCHINSNNEST